jgi:3-methyladenine DNA glycosylase/8-oxoguanine DNA glycosylase
MVLQLIEDDVNMREKRKPIQVQLNENERADLEKLAGHWGASYSSVFRRLLREYQYRQNANSLYPITGKP